MYKLYVSPSAKQAKLEEKEKEANGATVVEPS